MLEKYLFSLEKKGSFFRLFNILLISSLIVSFVISFFAKSSIFVITFISLLLAVPVSKYLKLEDRVYMSHKFSLSELFVRYEKELFIFWSIFIVGILISYLLNIFGFEFIYQEKIYESIQAGKFIDLNSSFLIVLINNIGILLLTFVLTFMINNSIIFVILWNSSVIGHFLYTSQNSLSLSLIMLPHILLEVSGYILVGIAAALLSYEIAYYKENKFKIFIKDFSFLFILGIVFIFLGAFVETL